MKNILWAFTAPVAFCIAAPAAAQDSDVKSAPASISAAPSSDDDDTGDGSLGDFDQLLTGLFGDAFAAEPLTADQEARLPQANLISSRIFPDGTFATMMNDTMKPMLEGIMGGAFAGMTDYPIEKISGLAGDEMLNPFDSGDAEKLAEITAILDPAYKERNRATMEVTVGLITEMMAQIEPAYRNGLAKAYAKRFTNDELVEINRFFETPIGARYAAESLAVTYDPQVMSAMNEMMPAMFELMPEMMTEMAALDEKYPAAKKFGELDAAQQKRLSDLLGVPVETLAENAAAMEAESEMVWDAEEEEEEYPSSEDVVEEAAE